MRKNCSRILALLLACVLTFAMAGQALAADTASPTPFGIRQSEYLKLNKPKNKAVYYKGETIPVSLTIAPVAEDYIACTAIVVLNEKTEDTVWQKELYLDGQTYKGSVNTKKFPTGSYAIAAATGIVDSNDDALEPLNNVEDSMVYAEFTLKTLKAPTSLKAAAGKRKVTITYKKAAGATKYEIYRSAQKSKGYQKIAATTKTKYVDTKAKKGKKYYYKVRTVRTGSGTVYSAYTGAKRTGKVK